MKEIQTKIEINAPASRVWEILTDFEKFPNWNPFVIKVEGDLAVGNQLKIEVQIPRSSKQKFTPTVLNADEDKELRWVGHVPPKLFRGEHYYKIEKIDENKVRFIHGELFSGLLVGLIWIFQGKKIEEGYHLMNKALKKRAEETK